MISPIFRKLFGSYLFRILNAFGHVILSLIILNYYGSDSLGKFTIYLSNSILFSYLVRQGYDKSLIFTFGRKKLSGLIVKLYERYQKRVFVAGFFFGLANCLAAVFIYKIESGVWDLLALGFLPGIVATAYLTASFATISGHISWAVAHQTGCPAVLTSVLVVVGELLGFGVNVLLIYVVSYLLIVCFGWLKVRALIMNATNQLTRISLPLDRALKGINQNFLLINFFTTYNSVFFFSFLGLFIPVEQIGEFRVVERIVQVFVFNLTFANLLIPKFGIKLLREGDSKGYLSFITKIFKIQIIVSTIILVPLLSFSLQISEYFGISSGLLFICPVLGQYFNAITGPVRSLLMYLDHRILILKVAMGEALIASMMYYIAYDYFGLAGVGVIYALSLTIVNSLLFYVYKNKVERGIDNTLKIDI